MANKEPFAVFAEFGTDTNMERGILKRRGIDNYAIAIIKAALNDPDADRKIAECMKTGERVTLDMFLSADH